MCIRDSLCFLKDINEISACKACVVEVQGKSKLITACNSPVEEGMVVSVSYTHLDVYKRQLTGVSPEHAQIVGSV